MTKLPVTRTDILEYMAALYAENPSRPNLQAFLSNPENYAKFISITAFRGHNNHTYSEKFLENPNYHLSPEVVTLFSTLRTLPPQQFSELLTRDALPVLQNKLLGSAEALHEQERARDLGYPNYSAVRIGDIIYSRNMDSRQFKDFTLGWENMPGSTYMAFFGGHNNLEAAALQNAVLQTSIVVTGAQQQFAFFDTNKHPNGKATVDIFSPPEKYAFDWKKEGDSIYVNVADKKEAARWIGLEIGTDRRGKLLLPNRSPWAVTLNEELKEGTPADLTVNEGQEVSFLPYQDPKLFSAVAENKALLRNALSTLDTALTRFAEQNQAAILGDQFNQNQLRQGQYTALIENFGEAFNKYVPQERLTEYYDKLFKDTPEHRRFFDLMEQTYRMLREQVAPITDPTDQQRVLGDIIKRYFDPNSKDYLLKGERPDVQEKMGKVLDILKTYKDIPALADKRVDEVLHQLDWELKERLIPKENREYRVPLNGSRCPACDPRLNKIIEDLMQSKGLIVSNVEPEIKLASMDPNSIDKPTIAAAHNTRTASNGVA